MRIGLSRAKSPDKFDFVLITFLILMGITSLVSIYSSFGIIGTSWDLIIKQSLWFVACFIALGVIIYLGNDSMLQFAKILYWILLGCLVLLLIGRVYYSFTGARMLGIVQTVNGATSWFIFPSPLGSFQPSEFMKIVLIIITAGIIDDHNKGKTSDSYEDDLHLFMKVAKWAIPPMVLTLMQPDTGVVLVTGISLVAMVLCSGIKKQWFMIFATLLTVFLITFFYMYFYHFDTLNELIGGEGGYKLARFNGWLNPEKSINGDGHQLYLSLLVLGSAGLTGYGMGQSLVKIPEAQTDFIFAVIGQSWGLIGTIFVLALCLGLDLHLCRIAMISKNMFEKYIIIGVLGMLLYQQFQNIGMIIGILPITGITLPLISYGGSSLLSYFLAFGIIMNASAKAKKLSDYVYE